MLSGDVGIGCGWPSAKLIGCKFRIETEIRSTNPLNSQAFSTQKRKPFRNPSKVKIQCFYMAKVKWINFNFEADLCGVGGRRSILRAPFRINVESIWIKFSWFHRWIEKQKKTPQQRNSSICGKTGRNCMFRNIGKRLHVIHLFFCSYLAKGHFIGSVFSTPFEYWALSLMCGSHDWTDFILNFNLIWNLNWMLTSTHIPSSSIAKCPFLFHFPQLNDCTFHIHQNE